eukprot:CAMPEP_0173260042 /NCGR_PEP_ID=MMETSP1142-20121109/25348_1 /TAXON_ID=483371 /ORGANISM="non described non described, Strain CCMP2298" /LENGTH=86 /DNA_ID=CAMNT_0014194723 /DNA_START=146 /DNA_END=403 /DNA_ORIENTATION=-
MRYLVDLHICACSSLCAAVHVRAWHISTSNLEASDLDSPSPSNRGSALGARGMEGLEGMEAADWLSVESVLKEPQPNRSHSSPLIP